MPHFHDPLIKHLQRVNGLTSNSLKEQYEAYCRKYPSDQEGSALLLNILADRQKGHQDQKMVHMCISHLKELHGE